MSLEQRGFFMKRDIAFLVLFTIILHFLPGCGGRIIDWGKDNFYQGQKLDKDIEDIKHHIKSRRVYDQFTLVGAFDVLWLADPVRTVYADIYSRKFGKTEEQKRVFLRRQLEENNHFISFYVLSLKEIVLGDKDSKWSVLLKVGDRLFTPSEMKTIEICPGYKEILGKKYNIFKDVYLVYFNAKDIEDNYIIDENVDHMALIFRSMDKEVELFWCIEDM